MKDSLCALCSYSREWKFVLPASRGGGRVVNRSKLDKMLRTGKAIFILGPVGFVGDEKAGGKRGQVR